MSQQLSSAATQAAIAALRDELMFQKVLLESLKDSNSNVDDKAAESSIKNEIQVLERRMKDMVKPNTSALTPPSPPFTFTSSASANNKIKHSPASSKMDYPLRRGPPGFQFNDHGESMGSLLSSTASTPSSGASMANPSRADLPTRKRSHSTHLDAGLIPFEENKSRRTSPSPFGTGEMSLSGSLGYGYAAIGDGYFDLTADDEKFDFMDNDFLEQQRLEEERLRQQKLDEDFARRLQQGSYDSSPHAALPSSNTPSAFDRISGVRPQPSSFNSFQLAGSHTTPTTQSFNNGDEALRRSLPSHSKRTGGRPENLVKAEAQLSSFGNISARSREPSNTDFSVANNSNSNGDSLKMEENPSSTRLMPGAWDDSSTASDSDVEIIEAYQFQPNRKQKTSSRQAQTYSRPNQTVPFAQTTNTSSSGLQLAGLQQAIYGTQDSPQWISSGLPPTPEASISNGAGSSLTYGNSFNSYPSGFGYGNTHTGFPSSSYAPTNSDTIGSMQSAYANGGMHTASLGYTVNNIPMYPGASQHSMTSNDFYNSSFSTPFTNEMANRVEYIMNDPRKTSQEIQELLQNIKTEVEIPQENREGTPEGLKYPLYEHQKIALSWLKSMEEGSNKGGILADDMGLGKTISSLALLLSRPSTDRARKTTLIVGPVALVRQWEREIRMKTLTKYRLTTHMAHGSGKKLGWDELKEFDIVLTTYGTLGAELGRIEKHEEEMRSRGIREPDAQPMKKTFPFLGPKSKFYRIILDEAQCIKNRNTKAARAACRLEAVTRFCLTGTPMMNNIQELYSLFRFLRIKPYNSWQNFSEQFGCLSKGAHGKGTVDKAMQKLQAVLKATLLRRTKTSLIDGKPIIVLPPKVEETQHVVFNSDELDYYKALENKTQVIFNKYKKAGTVGKNYSNVLVLLLRLRQCCCHPHLIIDLDEEAPASVAELSTDAMIDLAKSLAPEVVGRLLAADGFECPVCYDAVSNPSIVIPCGHDTCSECLTKISEQAIQANVQNGNEGGGNSSCPTCRGVIDMKKIIDYNAFKKVHLPADQQQEDKVVSEDSDTESDTDTDSDDSDDSDDGDAVDDQGNLDGFVVPDDYSTEDEAEDADNEGTETPVQNTKKKSKKKEKRRHDKKGKGKKEVKQKQHLSISMMKKEASRSAEGRKKYMRYLRKNWEPSAKVDKCVELLERFHDEGEKTIIFSQFVSLLDLLQVPIEKKGWKCERYDGGMNSQRRNDAIVRFTEQADCKIMLISLKAGNAGLNLVAASRVIILDPFWNPFIEMQAVDRAYRIGQMKSVEVHRILVEGTVEDRILELQQQKRELVDAALDEGAMKSLGRLDERQLAFLFGV